MTEFGLFNDEGCVERGMWSRAEAETRLAEAYRTEEYSDEDEVHVGELCSEHEEQEATNCEECAAEDSDDDDEDEDEDEDEDDE